MPNNSSASVTLDWYSDAAACLSARPARTGAALVYRLGNDVAIEEHRSNFNGLRIPANAAIHSNPNPTIHSSPK
jgi:hypothetical protein